MPPDCKAAAPSARDRKIVRKDEEAERQHPEAENWQKAENATEDKQCAGCHSCDARARHWDPQRAKNQLAVLVINTETLFSGLIRSIFLFSHPQEMGASAANASSFHFFEKTAWQIGKAFVLPRSRRGQAVIPGSSAVEHSTVNRQVAGSNPARGASFREAPVFVEQSEAGAFFPTSHPAFETHFSWLGSSR